MVEFSRAKGSLFPRGWGVFWAWNKAICYLEVAESLGSQKPSGEESSCKINHPTFFLCGNLPTWDWVGGLGNQKGNLLGLFWTRGSLHGLEKFQNFHSPELKVLPLRNPKILPKRPSPLQKAEEKREKWMRSCSQFPTLCSKTQLSRKPLPNFVGQLEW